MSQARVVDRIRIEDFEKFHAPRFRKAPPPVTFKEVVVTILVCTVMAPFLFTTCISMLLLIPLLTKERNFGVSNLLFT
jgi:hypothetical protein